MSHISITKQNSIRTTHTLKISRLYNLMLAFVYILFVPAFVTRIVKIPMWTYISLVIIFFIDFFIAVKQFHKLSKFKLALLLSMFYLYFFIITIIVEPSEMVNCFIRTFVAISFVFYTEFLFKTKKIDKVICVILLAFEIFNYINLISMLIHPYGMFLVMHSGNMEAIVPITSGYTRTYGRVLWLLGHQTNIHRYTLPAITLAIIHCSQGNSQRLRLNLRAILLIGCCLIETYIAKSASNIIVLVIFTTMMIMTKLYGKIKIWQIVVTIIFVYSFIIIGTDSELGFSQLTELLGREVTLNTRLPIWLRALEYFKQSPIFGHGYINEDSVEIRSILGLGNPHSAYLWTLVEGGVIGAMLLVYIISCVIKPLKNVKSCIAKRAIISAFVALIISMITDDHIFRLQMSTILFFLCYYSTEIVNEQYESRGGK